MGYDVMIRRNADGEVRMVNKMVPDVVSGRAPYRLSCGHSIYWDTGYGNCMVCRAEQAKQRVKALEDLLREAKDHIDNCPGTEALHDRIAAMLRQVE